MTNVGLVPVTLWISVCRFVAANVTPAKSAALTTIGAAALLANRVKLPVLLVVLT